MSPETKFEVYGSTIGRNWFVRQSAFEPCFLDYSTELQNEEQWENGDKINE
jgi:hypothetical protein